MFFEFLSQKLLCPNGIIVVGVLGEEFLLAFRTEAIAGTLSMYRRRLRVRSIMALAIISSPWPIGKRPEACFLADGVDSYPKTIQASCEEVRRCLNATYTSFMVPISYSLNMWVAALGSHPPTRFPLRPRDRYERPSRNTSAKRTGSRHHVLVFGKDRKGRRPLTDTREG